MDNYNYQKCLTLLREELIPAFGCTEPIAIAYAAAKAAMEVFSNYVNHGTKRTLPGFKKKDFNYKFFMTPAAFKAQNLNFSKLEYEQYKGHVFFVDWISG